MIKAALISLALLATQSSSYDRPESCYWHRASGHWFVSNVAGSPLAKDGNGWLSKLDETGNVVAAKWVGNLDAPKGMRDHGGKLYVADVDRLRIIDLESGKLEKSVTYEGAKFLNDVTVGSDGTVYVSDMFTSKIHTYKDGVAGTFLEVPELEYPNGILVDGGNLVIATRGPGLDLKTFGTKEPGRVLLLDLKTKKLSPFGKGERIGDLDGIEKYDGGYLVTHHSAGTLYHVTTGGAKLLREGFVNGADIGFDPDRKVLCVPEMGANKITLVPFVK